MPRVLGRAACTKKGECKGQSAVQTLCEGKLEIFSILMDYFPSAPLDFGALETGCNILI
jgi:hypothetical protein